MSRDAGPLRLRPTGTETMRPVVVLHPAGSRPRASQPVASHPAGSGIGGARAPQGKLEREEATPPRRRGLLTALRRDESGAVTAEYAIIIMAGVAFAGVLVAIIRSKEIRDMLVTLVQNSLGIGG